MQEIQPIILHEPSDVFLRLFAFPHAGGSSTSFRDWPKFLIEGVELVSYQLPGRGALKSIPPLRRIEPIVDALTDMVAAADDGTPYIFFGHSFGALLAHLVCEELRMRGASLPRHIILSAHRAPHMQPRHEPGGRLKFELPDAEFLDVVKSWGLVSNEILSDQEFLQLALPALRADLEVDETCIIDIGRVSSLPATLFYGVEDPTVTKDELEGWSSHYSELSVETFHGGHFYTVECEKSFSVALNHILAVTQEACPRAIMTAAAAQELGNETLWQRFEKEVWNHPTRHALVEGDRTWQFDELRKSAISLASALREHGVIKGDAIGFFLPHCAEYSIGILASTYLGAPACLLEKGWSDDILHTFIEAVKPKVIITIRDLVKRLPDELKSSGAVLLVGEDALPLPEKFSQSPAAVVGDDIAMISMTSGSMGKPKAVLTTHRGCLFCFQARYDRYPYRPDSREGLNVFFAWECLRPILQGVTAVVVPDDRIFDPVQLVEILERECITRIIATPSLLESVLDNAVVGPALNKRLAHMEMWLLMGEVVTSRIVAKARDRLPKNVGLVNAYSTWESLDIAFADLLVETSQTKSVTVPVGKILDGSTAIILDTKQRPVPYGATGELYFASPGIAPGYFQDAVKTAERFIHFGKKNAEWGIPEFIYYRTGDRARFLPDGQLQVLGRLDDTVKLRGFKVSLLATERVLEAEPGVVRAIVIPVIDSETGQPIHTVAYIHGIDGMPSETTLARVRLRGSLHLPEYARPRHYVGLDHIPLREGESRKLDLSKLPAPPDEMEPFASSSLSAVESKIATAWRSVLKIKHVQAEDNFFSLGGDSLAAARLTSALADQYGISLSVLDVFDYPTIAQMASVLNESGTQPHEIKCIVDKVPRQSTKLAVVGMAGRFPGADSIFSFWENLKAGKDTLSIFDRETLERKGVPPEVINHPNWVPVAQKINDADKFDAGFWSISKRESEIMDPQHRVFIEVAAAALEQAGYLRSKNPYRYRTGVFASCGIDGYLVHHLDGGGLKTPLDPTGLFLTEIGNEKDYIATRVSYLLDLGGPSLTVTSACSSTLVAVAQAAQSILSGQCDMAIAGGSSINFPNFGYRYENGLVGSVDGHVRPFDQEASGTLFGDSVGAVVLKHLDDAIADGDHIWAVMSGFGLSNDGIVKAGYAAPSAKAQTRCISDAIKMANIDSEAISYVECHATATLVGDAIEIKGLKDAFDAHRAGEMSKPGTCRIGSVKGNIGHANCAAGITGFIKTVLSLHHRSLVKTANFDKLNHKLVDIVECNGSPFSVQTNLEPWEVSDPNRQLPRRAGVSSFGIGGTNAHVILEEAPEFGSFGEASRLHLATITGKSPEALARNCSELAGAVAGMAPDELTSAIWALNTRREHHQVRAATVITGNSGEAATKIAALAHVQPKQTEGHAATIAFCFSGQGSQHPAMARALYSGIADGGRFRTRFELVCRHLATHLEEDPVQLLLHADEISVKRPIITQCGLFAVEYALAASLIDIGLRPVAMAGHSVGEYAAAAISGIVNLEDAARLVANRALASEAMLDEKHDANHIGGMLSVAGDVQQINQWLEANKPDTLWLAVENTSNQIVIAGRLVDLEPAEYELTKRGFHCRRVSVSHPFHSPLMQPVADKLNETARGIVSQAPTIPMASNVSGTWFNNSGVASDYWSRHVTSRVLWSANVEKLLQWEPDIILEIGPGAVLTNLIGKHLRGRAAAKQPIILPSLSDFSEAPMENECRFLSMLGTLWSHGASINWEKFHESHGGPPKPRRQPVLPTYSFEKTSFWARPDKSIYVDPHATSIVVPEPNTARCLVRTTTKPAARIKLYCFPFAGGSAATFKHWSKNSPNWLDIVAVEYPRRSGKNGEIDLQDGSADSIFLQELSASIRDDAGNGHIAFCGVSLGVTVATALLNGPLRDLADSKQIAGLILVGRSPFGVDESEKIDCNEFLLTPPDMQLDLLWREQVLPLLKEDLALDARLSTSLSTNIAKGPIVSAPLQIHCGNADHSFSAKKIYEWAALSSHALLDAQIHEGDHSFIIQAEREIFERAVTFLDLALWTMGLTQRGATDTVYKVLTTAVPKSRGKTLVVVQPDDNLNRCITETKRALASDAAVAISFCGILNLLSLDRHMAWLMEYLQRLIASDALGEILLALPANAAGGGLGGLSSTLAQEGIELKVRRLFIPDEYLWEGKALTRTLQDAISIPEENELIARNGCYFARRLTQLNLPDLARNTLCQVPGTYLVTGATGGLGSAVIGWLIEEQGVPAERIVAVSRRGTPDQTSKVRDISLGLDRQLDLRAVLHTGERLAGIFHLAATLDDRLFMHQTPERVQAVMAPKRALSDLISMSREFGTPWLVAFSSVSSLLGTPGQSSYAAANAYLDAVASWETLASGPDVASIHWGSWADVGMTARSLKALQTARSSGEFPLIPERALQGLGKVIGLLLAGEANGGRFAICDVDWSHSPWRNLPLISALSPKTPSTSTVTYAKAEAPAATTIPEADTTHPVRTILGAYVHRWDETRTLQALGLDSLDFARMRGDFSKIFGKEVPLTLIARPNQTLGDLYKTLCSI
ncbi:alpha/beta fold hydrolase [Agrobacterium vitis]|uniref:type I polyketide synthase n=1 Tax=Rhizobium/Agrobacterium group TaxID=227290 RepID=UPI0012E9133F|nr:type I polyketide synthase [Agrobacterium vitis]MCF1436845.1 alpha/beta fold hydrolase [Allorhizobium ampelinum]MUO92321.1 alpha/beta fold hydrolase [Agrobacterium vitis]MUZ55142.1 alpha/beta fold hydrolase [Agrobacterium vitis]MUZ94277.1 alpha/beta fold hydrolase [Agrobacterium vitis]MVA43201.1 alpha/beta fold hydrolase [Agrobacterium vitis]